VVVESRGWTHDSSYFTIYNYDSIVEATWTKASARVSLPLQVSGNMMHKIECTGIMLVAPCETTYILNQCLSSCVISLALLNDHQIMLSLIHVFVLQTAIPSASVTSFTRRD
jgi:hypothetical protein